MNEPNPGSEGGWNAARVIGMIIGVLGMVGFGFCSLCGLVIGFSDSGRYLGTVLAFSIPGLVLAFLFFLLIRTVRRRARGKRVTGP